MNAARHPWLFGASLTAMRNLGRLLGYSLVHLADVDWGNAKRFCCVFFGHILVTYYDTVANGICPTISCYIENVSRMLPISSYIEQYLDILAYH